MALMQLTIVPMGVQSISGFVAEIQDRLKACGLSFTMHDMGTIIEGEADELLSLAAQIHQMPFAHGVKRVLTQISIDDRRDKVVRLGDKQRTVKKLLGAE